MSVMGKWELYIGDKTTPCPKCGKIGVIVSGDHRQTNGEAVAVDGSIIHCDCPSGSNFLIAPGTVEISDPFGMSEPPVNNAVAVTALSALPVFAKSCLRGEGCTDAGTDQESVDNFGHCWLLPSTSSTGTNRIGTRPTRAGCKETQTSRTDIHNQKINSRGISAFTVSSDAPKAAASAGSPLMQQLRPDTQQCKNRRNLSTAGRWIARVLQTVFLFGMFYSPKLNSGEQDYIDKMRLSRPHGIKKMFLTRVRFRWEADQFGTMRPKGFTSAPEVDRTKCLCACFRRTPPPGTMSSGRMAQISRQSFGLLTIRDILPRTNTGNQTMSIFSECTGLPGK